MVASAAVGDRFDGPTGVVCVNLRTVHCESQFRRLSRLSLLSGELYFLGADHRSPPVLVNRLQHWGILTWHLLVIVLIHGLEGLYVNETQGHSSSSTPAWFRSWWVDYLAFLHLGHWSQTKVGRTSPAAFVQAARFVRVPIWLRASVRGFCEIRTVGAERLRAAVRVVDSLFLQLAEGYYVAVGEP